MSDYVFNRGGLEFDVTIDNLPTDSATGYRATIVPKGRSGDVHVEPATNLEGLADIDAVIKLLTEQRGYVLVEAISGKITG